MYIVHCTLYTKLSYTFYTLYIVYNVHYVPENNSFLKGVCVYAHFGKNQLYCHQGVTDIIPSTLHRYHPFAEMSEIWSTKAMIRNWLGFECRPSPKQLMMACILFIICANLISFRVKLSKKCVFLPSLTVLYYSINA